MIILRCLRAYTLNSIHLLAYFGYEIMSSDHDDGIFLVVSSTDPVIVRERTDKVLSELKDLHTTSNSKFIERFEIDIDEEFQT